jgi:hypothetical protein
LLWLAFAGLLGGSGDLLLRACGIGAAPWPAFLRSWLPNSCASASPSAGADIQQIEAIIQDKEMALVGKIAACGPNCAPVSPAQIAPPVPPSILVPPNDRVQRAIDDQRVKHGRIEISLVWEGRTDLDLHVKCPNDEILHGQRQACGGELDRDANAGEIMEHPVEHVVWANSMPPAGEYHVIVVAYLYRDSDRPGSLKYTVRMTYRFDDGQIVILKEVADRATIEEKLKDEAFAFTSPITPPAHP